MRRDIEVKTGSIAGTSDLTILAPIRQGLVPSLESMTYKSRAKRVLRALHAGRLVAHEHELVRMLSDAVERVGRIHSVRIAVLEPEDKILLAVTFDGAWESYVRVIWQKVARLLDLIFCNTEDYVLGWCNSYEQWGQWLRGAQVVTPFFYASPGVSYDDIQYLRMQERVVRRNAQNDLPVTQLRVPTAETIATDLYKSGVDPSQAGCGDGLPPERAGRPAFRQGVRSLVGLYRLADVYPPGTDDGLILHRAAQELLPEFFAMLRDGGTYQSGRARALERFEEQVRWFESEPEPLPTARRAPPLPQAPTIDAANVQGGIVSAYPEVTHGALVLLIFDSADAFAHFLARLRPTAQAASDGLGAGDVAVNFALTPEGLRLVGLSDEEMQSLPEEFVQGMERRAGLLGDLRINHPRRWRLPALNWADGTAASDPTQDDPVPRVALEAVHAALILKLRPSEEMLKADREIATGAARQSMMTVLNERIGGDGSGTTPLSIQWMQAAHWPPQAGGPVGHFGFADGGSQPVLDRASAGRRYENQVHLGELLCGHANAADAAPPAAWREVGLGPLLHDGSYLVVRKLRQDVDLLDAILTKATADAPPALTREELLAKMMGRWPSGHPNAGEPLVGFVTGRTNDFNYDNDPVGSACPLHAHIRRANPRDTEPAPNSRPARIARRAMSYGPADGQGAERGLVFMAYNASIGEQFEVVQRWVSGGNSSGSYSGQGDPLLGLAEPGCPRYYRFEKDGLVLRVALDGDPEADAEPRPLVRLEWGAYLFAPSLSAIDWLARRAQQAVRTVPWSAEVGEREIRRLRTIEAVEGEAAARLAWKAALEDPTAQVDFLSASVWAAIRRRHGGVLRTPLGVLVADRSLVDRVLLDARQQLTATGYLPRMRRGFGEIYLGMDAGQVDGRYERESEDCNKAIAALSTDAAYRLAWEAADRALAVLAERAERHAREDGEARWALVFELGELLDPALADACEEWFGFSEQGGWLRRGGQRRNWQPGEPPSYPGHLMAPSRYIFQPHPEPRVEQTAAEQGHALGAAMTRLLAQHGAGLTAPVARAVLDATPPPGDLPWAARTLVGAAMGFAPTVDGNVRRMLNEWLRDGSFWSLRTRHAQGGTQARSHAADLLHSFILRGMQLRPVPEVLWRTATVSHELGRSKHAVTVRPGEPVVAGLVSATQQSLEEGGQDLSQVFGGNRPPPPQKHPTHACPGYGVAMAFMSGFLGALVFSRHALRPGPGPLSFAVEGQTRPLPPKEDIPVHEGEQQSTEHSFAIAGDTPSPPAFEADILLRKSGRLRAERSPLSVSWRDAPLIDGDDAEPAVRTRREPPVRLWAFGDSWVYSHFLGSLVRSNLSIALGELGYKVTERHGSYGALLAEMAATDRPDRLLPKLVRALRNIDPGPDAPQGLIVSGGGNDVAQPSSEPRKTPLFGMLASTPDAGDQGLVEANVNAFIDVQLSGRYEKILDLLTQESDLPIFMQGYDHPIPDGLSEFGAWLKPVFDLRWGVGIGSLDLRRRIMQRLIDRLNAMLGRVAGRFPSRAHHVLLAGRLAQHPSYAQDYRRLWDDELHPSEEGCDWLAIKFAAVLAAKIPA